MTASRSVKSAAKLVFHKVDEARWDDFAALFESPGAPKYCWCMAWRATAAEARDMKNPERKTAMRKRSRPACRSASSAISTASRSPGARSRRARPIVRSAGSRQKGRRRSIWSLACFFLKRSVRGQGLGRRTLEAAVAHARAEGAKVVEAYPVDPDSPSYRFMGFVEAFKKAGFREVCRAGSRRHVMRLEV